MIRVSRYVSLLAVAPLLAACASDKPYDPTDYSGRACDNTPGVACVWAGVPGIQGFGSQKVLTQGDGQPINESWLDFPADLTFAPDGTPWVIDWNNHRVRVVHTDGTFQTIIGTGQEGDGPVNPKTGVFEPQDEMPYPTAPGCAPEIVQLNHPTDIQFAPDGTLDMTVPMPTSNLTKLCFGGEDMKTVYVTSARAGLSAEKLASQPLAGSLLAFDSPVAGFAGTRVRLS